MGSLWNRSGTIERFADDLKAVGAQAFFFSGGTTTPLTVYEDAAENIAHDHPVVADAHGRWPDIFVPYTLAYDVQVKTAEGVQLTYTQNIPNPDPVELSVTPDPAADVVTGMIHPELANTTKSGYVRLNGRTLGNAASSATERANADTSDLFTYLWNNLTDAIAPVSGGRGGSAASDFAANKTITLVDCRGCALVGLDDMGNSAGSFFSGLTFDTGNATTAGSRLGANSQTITASNMPAHSHGGTTASDGAHTHTGTTGVESATHTHSGTTAAGGDHDHTGSLTAASAGLHSHLPPRLATRGDISGGGSDTVANGAYQEPAKETDPDRDTTEDGAHTHTVAIGASGTHTHSFTSGDASATHTHSFTSDSSGVHTHTFTTDTQGSGTPFNNMGRSIAVTWYIKL